MKLVYTAGPYRSPDGICGIAENIHKAGQIAFQLWHTNLAVMCPHKNTAFFDGTAPDDWKLWMAGDLEILSRCDAIVMIPGWRESQGAIAEWDFALQHNIPVFFYPQDMEKIVEFAYA